MLVALFCCCTCRKYEGQIYKVIAYLLHLKIRANSTKSSASSFPQRGRTREKRRKINIPTRVDCLAIMTALAMPAVHRRVRVSLFEIRLIKMNPPPHQAVCSTHTPTPPPRHPHSIKGGKNTFLDSINLLLRPPQAGEERFAA